MSRSLNSFLCVFINLLALVLTGVFMHLLYANQMLHFQWTYLSGRHIASPLRILQNNSSSNLGRSQNGGEIKIMPAAIHWSTGRLDNRRMLRIYEWVWTGEQWDELTRRFDVCLSTQSSVDRLDSIAEVSEKWLGPISLAVYIQIPDQWIALNLFVMYMLRCSAPFSQTVSIHVVVPINYNPSNNDNSRLANFPLWSTHSCGQPSEFLAIVMEEIVTSRIEYVPYPQNHMRNVARKTCGTPWVFMTDVDIIPRPNSAQMLQEFYDSPASKKCSRCAFVIPTYELSLAAKYPESKKELIQYANKGLARPFHLKVFISGNLATNYSTWNHTNLEESPIKISHNSGTNVSYYEPFYIGPDAIPAHQERFIGYGFTRSSQVLEAIETGWMFKVLTPIFAIHWGLQDPQNISKLAELANDQNTRSNETINNRFVYKDFVAELKARKAISLTRNKKKKARRSKKLA